MTVYGDHHHRARSSRLRPTLRLRLTMLNGLLLAGAGLLLLLLAWLLVHQTTDAIKGLDGNSTVVTANGEHPNAAVWSQGIERKVGGELLVKGALAVLVISLAGVGSYLVTGRALRPLHQVTATARRLSTETLDQRLNHHGADDEVRELADTFDEMLDRLSAAFGSQKRFVANASHELRTPLAVMRTEIDVTLADPDASREELRRMGVVVRDASRRANDLIEALLLLARTEAQAGRRLNRQVPVDLAMGVPVTLSAVNAELARLNLDVSTDFSPAMVIGDPSLLERLAGNLVENAVRYNVHHGRLSVRTYTDARFAYLIVGNTGPELDAGEVPGLFEPFRRGGIERTGTRGAGLGLSIVRAVVDAHGGSVRAQPLTGGGLEVTVALPSASATGSDAEVTVAHVVAQSRPRA
ncbi:MAG: histidine kinase [Actinomycetia bacterium]|nr:histidine kinase [Actinomycetes bacterium]